MSGGSDRRRERQQNQQAALAEFGSFALRCDDLDAVLAQACRLVRRGVGTELSKVLERQPDGRTLLVRAGDGWAPGIVGHAVVAASKGSAAGTALETGMPVVSDDVDREDRFSSPSVLRDHGVRSLANVVILGAGDGPPFGVLEVDSRRRRAFSDDDIAFLQGYANLIAAAVQRQAGDAALRAATEDRERLLQELQHRIRNNLQIVASLVRLQARRARSDDAREELDSVGRRIEAMRLLHELLSASAAVDGVDLAAYLERLANGLVRFQTDGLPVDLETSLDPVIVAERQVVPLGLIVNEFVTNSLKHAFGAAGGRIGVELTAVDGGGVRLTLWDNGGGMPPQRGDGMGLRLIAGLARQINGDAAWDAGPGTRLVVTFPAEAPA